jgi:ankyrin repeat protein
MKMKKRRVIFSSGFFPEYLISPLRRSNLVNSADPNICDSNFWTPLHAAADSCLLEMCKLLLSHGASTKFETNEGNYPINYLVKNPCKKEQLQSFREVEQLQSFREVTQLLQLGINLNHKTFKGETVLHYCCRGKNLDVMEDLLKNGASCNILNA